MTAEQGSAAGRIRLPIYYRLFGDLRGGWWWTSLLTSLLVLLPVLALIGHASQGSGELWPHLLTYVLPPALKDTLVLLLSVGVVVTVIGTGCAWLVTAYEFPGRRVLSWALLLPLAVPTYIVAFAYLDLLHPVGSLQTALRELLGYTSPRDFRLPDIRSIGGCILLLGLVLYPYVYLPTRALFLMQASGVLEASRSLGASSGRTFFRVALPLARPAIAVGTSLALMEALNDIGAAEFLGVRTMTVSIYATWVNRGSLAGAAQIALFMLALVIGLLALERWARRHQVYATSGRQTRMVAPQSVRGAAGWGLFALASLPVLLGFLLPTAYLALEAYKRIQFAGIESSIVREIFNTLSVAALATLVTSVLAFVLVYSQRLAHNTLGARLMVRCASLGYAIPGTVVAIGLLAPLSWLDAGFGWLSQSLLGMGTGLLMSGSAAALIYAYSVRFLAIGSGSLEAGFSKIPRSLDDTSRSLGAGANRRAAHILLPLSRPALAAAMLLIFVDCMKELPATLLLRPLNFETLATHLYAEAARGSYESGAIAALLIVIAGLVPIVLLARLGSAAQYPAVKSVKAELPA